MNLNDYLDIYCPHYPDQGSPGSEHPEMLALYLVGEKTFQGCVETRGAIKRWECNTPFAQFGPVRFSEKIQRFTPFSLGFEFLPGGHYYYSCEQIVCVFLFVVVVVLIMTSLVATPRTQTSYCTSPLYLLNFRSQNEKYLAKNVLSNN